MRILLTNHTLAHRAGTELFVRDLALALLDRDHEPIAYSRHLGDLGQELRQATIPVLDDLESLDRPPDLIHAHHHLEAMTALTRFPRAPALYVCHGWLPAQEAPPRHPRILRYLAVDELVRQRLLDECGIPEAKVELRLNFVDLQRFQPRAPLPERPARALVFSNYVSDENCLPVIREACRVAGLELDTVGRLMGNLSRTPEDLLGRYDIVFAKARAALEAAAVGTAVILCDAEGLGPMVTAAELPHLRAFNLGTRLLRQPCTVEGIAAELARYDPADAAEVRRILRAEASLDAATEDLVRLYQAILEEFDPAAIDPEEEARATSHYLRWGPLQGGDFAQREIERLQAAVAEQRGRSQELLDRLTHTLEEHRRQRERPRSGPGSLLRRLFGSKPDEDGAG